MVCRIIQFHTVNRLLHTVHDFTQLVVNRINVCPDLDMQVRCFVATFSCCNVYPFWRKISNLAIFWAIGKTKNISYCWYAKYSQLYSTLDINLWRLASGDPIIKNSLLINLVQIKVSCHCCTVAWDKMCKVSKMFRTVLYTEHSNYWISLSSWTNCICLILILNLIPLLPIVLGENLPLPWINCT